MWVADITQQRTDQGWLYMWRSCWTGSPDGSSAGPWPSTCALNWCWTPSTWRSPSASPLQGWSITLTTAASQDTSLTFGRRLQQAGLVASMGTVGDALDNAVAESFFATLECELLDRYDWPTRQALRTAVFDFIEVFYRGRDRPCGRPPAQIPACAANALGS